MPITLSYVKPSRDQTFATTSSKSLTTLVLFLQNSGNRAFFLRGTLPKWEQRDESSIVHVTSRNRKEKRFGFPLPLSLEMRTHLMHAIDLPFYFESENNGTKRNGALRGIRVALKIASDT